MGIKDLLRFMKPFVDPVHIKKYSGKRVGIDAYSWLHKGAYSCSMELCLDSRSEKKSRYLEYFMHRINLLRHYKVIPVVVFDGGNIPCKSATEEERQRKREANLASAKQKLHEGNVGAAIELFQRAIGITPSMAYQLIQILRSEDIEFVVAPYEADAQLAYLSSLDPNKGGITAVITEDSDLMAYGCQAVIFKMDRYGNGEEIMLDKVFKSNCSGLSFQKFDKELFTGMCVLAGCDFLPSIPGIGIKRAYTLVSKYRNLDRVLSVLKYDKGSQIPDGYFKSFKESIAVFQHARIYDGGNKKLKHMKPLSSELLQYFEGDIDFLGPDLSPSIAIAIAEGRVDPITMESFDISRKYEQNLNSGRVETRDHSHGAESCVASPSQNFFTFIPPPEKRTGSDNITGEKETFTVDDCKFKSEVTMLERLLNPQEIHRKPVKNMEERREIPDNNPFKRRKKEEIEPDSRCNMSGEASTVTDNTKSCEYLSETPESQESVKSKYCTSIEQGDVKKMKSKKNHRSSEINILRFFSRTQ